MALSGPGFGSAAFGEQKMQGVGFDRWEMAKQLPFHGQTVPAAGRAQQGRIVTGIH